MLNSLGCQLMRSLLEVGVGIRIETKREYLRKSVRYRFRRQSMASGLRHLLPANSQLGIFAPSFSERRSRSPSSKPRVVEIECKKRERGDRGESFAPYHVTVVTPPPRNLGIHSLPPNTQCGETVEVKGEPYIVSGVTYRYQLRRGKYEPSQKRLDVQSMGRYFVNLYLDNLLETS